MKVLLRNRRVSAVITLAISQSLMKFFSVLAVSLALLTAAQAVEKPSAHTKGTPTGNPTGPLKPGEYSWKPQLSPSGPLVVLVRRPRANHARVSQRHSHRPREREHRLEGPRHAGG